MTVHECPNCGNPVTQTGRGRPRRWCSDYCRRRGDERDVTVHEIVRERTVRSTERISRDRLIARLLDDPDATDQLLQTLAHRWRHRASTDIDQQQKLKAAALDIWQAVHAPAHPDRAQNPPPLPTAAADYRAAVEKVMSSPRSIRDVLTRVREMIDTNQIRAGAAGDPIRNGVAELLAYRTPRRY